MGIFSKLAAPFRASSEPTQPKAQESVFYRRRHNNAPNVTANSAMNLATVYAAVRVLSEGVAALPMSVYKEAPDGSSELLRDHPLQLVLKNPNEGMTSFSLMEHAMQCLLLDGNAYFRAYRSGGRIIALVPTKEIPEVKVDDAMRVTYILEGRKMPKGSILRINGLGSDGITGESVISHLKNTIGVSMSAEGHASNTLINGLHPRGVLETEGTFRDAQAVDNLRSQFEQSASGENSGRPLVLEKGLKFSPIVISNSDAQFLESRQFSREEIAAGFRVPPHLLGDLSHATFSNIESQSMAFVRDSLAPWLKRIELAIERDLLDPAERVNTKVRFNMSAALRGDTASRYAAYAGGITNGFLTRNEVRHLENLNPIEGLDDILVPLNMTTTSAKEEEESAIITK